MGQQDGQGLKGVRGADEPQNKGGGVTFWGVGSSKRIMGSVRNFWKPKKDKKSRFAGSRRIGEVDAGTQVLLGGRVVVRV